MGRVGFGAKFCQELLIYTVLSTLLKRFYVFRKTELWRKQEKTSIFVEKELIVPNPSLDDFGKRSGYQSADEDIRINNLYENDQDPAVMLRILSWLKQVENNSDFFYGFDEN